MIFRWYGDKVTATLRAYYLERLKIVAKMLVGRIKEKISHAGTGRKWPGARRASSKPGEPPARQTGDLMKSITHEIDAINLRAVVGTNLQYARKLELGDDRIEPRPYLRSTLTENEPLIKDIILQRVP